MNNIGIDRVCTDKNYDFKNIFNDFTDNDKNINIYNEVGHTCNYLDIDDFQQKVSDIKKQISFFSSNIRSLPGKWNEFPLLIQSLNHNNFKFTVVGLTEIWNVPPNFNFNLPGYSPLIFSIRNKSGLNNNAGGGVGMWIDSSYNFEVIDKLSVFEEGVFESQFIKLKTSKSNYCIVGNIYRPNTAPKASIKKYTDILFGIMQTIHSDPDLKQCKSIELLGDFNIDLLKFNSHKDTANYIDMLFNHSLLPLITLPTRVIHNSATLIDNICTTSQDDRYDSGIIISDISDHLPLFYIKHGESHYSPQFHTKSRVITDKTIPVFKD